MPRQAATTDGSAKRSSLDPTGRAALFDAPVSAPPDLLRAGRSADGRAALFSTGPREAGTVVVDCSACHARSRVSLADIAGRLLNFSAYLPLVRRDHPHHMVCPECHDRTWCRIGWQE